MKPTHSLRRLLAGSSLAFVCVSFASAADGVFTWADLGGGDNDDNVGLSSSKTYVNAVNTQGGALTINGVNFEASSGGSPSGTNYSIAGVPSPYSGGTNNVSGQLGSLVDGFIYGGNPTSTFNLTGLTTGQTYSLAFYNRGWDKDYNRTQNITTTGGAATTFTSDFNNPGDLNILRYTFTATGSTETVNFNSAAGNTFHFYGFATEQVFNNIWTSGSDWSIASWSAAQPNGVGSNADFTAQGSPTSINLDANRTIGHIRFDGANAWTVSGANTLTLQADVGGVSVLGANSGSHTISTAVNLSSGLLKTGAGTVELSGALNAGSHNITLGAGTLALSGDTTNIGNSGTIGFGGGNLKVAANTSTGRALNFSSAGGIEVASGSTLTLTGGQWTGNGGFTKTGDGAMVVGSNLPSNDRFAIDSTRGGVFNMNTGSFTISDTAYFVMGDDGQNATFNMSGGTFTSNVAEGLYVGNGSAGISTLNITGGTFAHNGNRMRLGQGGTSTGILNIGGTASVTLPQINMGEVSASSQGQLNLSGTGMLTVGKIGKGNGSGEITFNGGTLRASANESTFMQGLNAATINAGGATIDSNGYAITIGQGLDGTGSLTKTGAGTLTLTGTNSYSGTTTINGGTLSVGALDNLGGTGALAFGGGTLQFTGTSGTTDRGLTFTGAGGIEVASGSTLTLTGGQWTGNGGFTKTGDGAMVVDSNFPGNDRFEIDSTRGGVFNMQAGSFTISSDTTYFVMGDDGQNATFNQAGGTFTNNAGGGVYLANGGGVSTMNITGGTFSSNGGPMRLGQGSGATGTLNIGGGAGLASVTLPSIVSSEVVSNATAAINLNNNGLLNVSKISKHTGAISVTFDGGTLQASANESAFMQGLDSATISAGGATIDSQAFSITVGQGMGGTGSLTKTGSGTLTLSGTNTYAGSTTVSAGTLVINGNHSAATGAVSVSNAGTRLKGDGTIGGDTTIHAGAIHSVGNSVGKQTFHDGTSTALTYAQDSIFEWELGATLKDSNTGGAARGTDWDAVNVSGGLATTGTGAIFRVVLDGATTFADTFWAQNRQWTDIFKTADDGSLVSFESIFSSFQHYNYSGEGDTLANLGSVSTYGSFGIDGSTLTWTAVPEPTSALAGLLISAGLLRRRRA